MVKRFTDLIKLDHRAITKGPGIDEGISTEYTRVMFIGLRRYKLGPLHATG